MGGNADREAVEQYYRHVDNKDFNKLFELMADDIIYYHGIDEIYDGLPEVKEMYNNVTHQEIEHNIEQILVEGDSAAVRGTTWALTEEGTERNTRFALFHDFNEEGKIREQRLYLNIAD